MKILNYTFILTMAFANFSNGNPDTENTSSHGNNLSVVTHPKKDIHSSFQELISPDSITYSSTPMSPSTRPSTPWVKPFLTRLQAMKMSIEVGYRENCPENTSELLYNADREEREFTLEERREIRSERADALFLAWIELEIAKDKKINKNREKLQRVEPVLELEVAKDHQINEGGAQLQQAGPEIELEIAKNEELSEASGPLKRSKTVWDVRLLDDATP